MKSRASLIKIYNEIKIKYSIGDGRTELIIKNIVIEKY